MNIAYIVGYKAILSWVEAESSCQRKGGHLTSVMSEEENALCIVHGHNSSGEQIKPCSLSTFSLWLRKLSGA